MREDVCKACGEKLKQRSGDAIYYCMKCNEETKIKDDISKKLKGD